MTKVLIITEGKYVKFRMTNVLEYTEIYEESIYADRDLPIFLPQLIEYLNSAKRYPGTMAYANKLCPTTDLTLLDFEVIYD